MKPIMFFLVLFFYSNKTFTQIWTQTYEDSGEVMNLINTQDGGYALISSFNPPLPSRFIKTNINGDEEWIKTLESISRLSLIN